MRCGRSRKIGLGDMLETVAFASALVSSSRRFFFRAAIRRGIGRPGRYGLRIASNAGPVATMQRLQTALKLDMTKNTPCSIWVPSGEAIAERCRL